MPRHCSGDATAFAELLQCYQGLVYTFLCRYGISAEQRDDLFQEIFLKVHLAAASYRPKQALRPWLVTIVLNTVRNFRRDQARDLHKKSNILTMPQATQPGADEAIAAQEDVHWMESCIAGLPDPQRGILLLAMLKNMLMKEISVLMHMPENTVKTHLRRARLALAEQLVEREAGEEMS